MIEEAGLPVSREIEIVPNGRKALLLAELARDSGRFDAFREAVFAAYWARGENIGDDAVLERLAREAGLDEHEARAELVEQQRFDRLQESTAEMLELGAGGVPAWVIDRRVLVPGAQPHEVFERVLARLGHEPRDGVGSRDR
jgi:predicted DsbA family dithiol-disulfide isomerase